MKVATLNDVAEWGSGGTPKRSIREYFGSEVPWLSIADLNDGVVNEAKESLTKEGLANSSAKLVPAGTLFIAMYGSIGKLGIAGRAMATSQAIAFAKPRTEVVDRRYLFHYLLSQRAKFQSRGRGGTQLNIGQSDLKAWPIPLPDLREQRRIADILDKADALRAERRESITQLDALGQSIFNEMFGDALLNVQSFDELPLVELCQKKDDIKCGPFGTQLGKNEYRPTGVPLWGIRQVNSGFSVLPNEFLDKSTALRLSAYSIEENDIVMTRKGDVGKCSIYPKGKMSGIMHSDVLRIRLGKDAVTEFVAHQLHHSRAIKRQIDLISQGAIMQGINVTKLKALRVLVPPLELQEEFARRVVVVENLKSKHRAQLAELDNLFLSLQDRAFKGEL